jgi:integrase/recombinase XerD
MNRDFEKARSEMLAGLRVRNYSPTSLAQYERDLGIFFRFLEEAGVNDLKAVGRETLKAFQLHLAEKKTPKGQPFTWGTRSAYFRAVRRLFDHLEKTRAIFLNPAQFIHDGKRVQRLPSQVMSEEEVEKMMAVPDLATPAGFRDRTIMEVFYSTGLRIAEMMALKVGDIDLQEKTVRVNHGKGAKDRVVPIGEKACEFVGKYLQEVRPLFLKRREEEPQALWISKKGQPLSQIIVQASVRHYSKRAGMPERVTPHGFRHAFATHLLRHGADIHAVSKMLGHASVRITQLYTHLAAVDVKKAHEETHPRERQGRNDPQEEAAVMPEILRLYKCPEGIDAPDKKSPIGAVLLEAAL